MTTREGNSGYPHYRPVIEEYRYGRWEVVGTAELRSSNGRPRRMGDSGYPHYRAQVEEYDGSMWYPVKE